MAQSVPSLTCASRCYAVSVVRRLLLVAIVACGCGGGKSAEVRVVGTPSPDLPVPSATGASDLPSCGSTATPPVGTWRAMSMQGAPPTTVGMGGVWTGSELAIIETDTQQGSPLSLNAYDPMLDRWRNIPVPTDVAFRSRNYPYLGVVAGKLIVYGGVADPPTNSDPLTDGWVVDLTTLTWTSMTTGPQLWRADDGFPRVFADGSRAVFVPALAYIQPNHVNVAVAAYDLSAQTWKTVPSPSSTNDQFGCLSPAWNGSQVLCQASIDLYTVTSSPLAVTSFPSLFVTGVGTVVSPIFSPVGDMFLGLGPSAVSGAKDLYWVDPTRQIWSASAQISSFGTRAATVNGQVLVWGEGSPGTTTSDGALAVPVNAEAFDPPAGIWSQVTCTGAPTWPFLGVTVATPSGLIVFDGADRPSSNAVLEL